MTDYTKLVKNLRDTERICRDRMDGQVMLDSADTIEALQAELIRIYKQLPKRGEIVRCGECAHRKDSIQCPLCSEGIETADDWFCADGEREVQE